MTEPTSAGQEVVLVLSDEFASRLGDLAHRQHVWARKTPATEQIAESLWSQPRSASDVTAAGITLFSGTGRPEDDLLSILDMIELHHGIASSGSPAVSLRVLGLKPTDAVRDAMGSLGFTGLEPIAGGFVARWHQP